MKQPRKYDSRSRPRDRLRNEVTPWPFPQNRAVRTSNSIDHRGHHAMQIDLIFGIGFASLLPVPSWKFEMQLTDWSSKLHIERTYNEKRAWSIYEHKLHPQVPSLRHRINHHKSNRIQSRKLRFCIVQHIHLRKMRVQALGCLNA